MAAVIHIGAIEMPPAPPAMTHAARRVLYRFTRGQYARMIRRGLLDEDEPIELLDGLLVVKEPQRSRHRTGILLVAKALERAFDDGWFVQTESPIVTAPGGATRRSTWAPKGPSRPLAAPSARVRVSDLLP